MKYLFAIFFAGIALLLKAQSPVEQNVHKAQAYIDGDNYAEAIKYINKALDHKKDISSSYKLANLYISRGMCKYKLGNYPDAESDMDLALKVSPDFLKAFEDKNLIYMEQKKYDKIISNSIAALSINPNDNKFLVSIAGAFYEKHDYPSVLLYADSALNNNPDELTALNLKEGVLYRQKKYTEALEINNFILSKKANDPGTYINRAIAYAKMQEYKKAEEDMLFAAKLDSGLAYITHNNIGFFIKMGEKDYQAAIVLFDKSIQLKPDFSNAYCNRGFCKMQLGDMNGATKDLKKAIELDPDNSFAYKNYALLKLQQKKTSEACSLLNTALSKGYHQEYDEDVDDLIKANCK